MPISLLFLIVRKCDHSITIFKNLLNSCSSLLVDNQHWISIAQFRRFLQRIGNDRLIFIDEIAIYAIMTPRQTLPM